MRLFPTKQLNIMQSVIVVNDRLGLIPVKEEDIFEGKKHYLT